MNPIRAEMPRSRKLMKESGSIRAAKLNKVRVPFGTRDAAKLTNPFLPPDAEENIYEIWVPSPDEIKLRCNEIQSGEVVIISNHNRRLVR